MRPSRSAHRRLKCIPDIFYPYQFDAGMRVVGLLQTMIWKDAFMEAKMRRFGNPGVNMGKDVYKRQGEIEPPYKILIEIAKYFNVSLYYILGISDKQKKFGE